MSKPTVGVVILNYNSHDLTLALAKRTASLPSVDFVCVVDNASGDHFDGEFSESNIHYIKSRENGGYSAGNNIGLRWLVEERCCEYVFIANPDVEFGDDAISAVSEVLHSDPCVAVAATRRFGHDGARVMQWYDLPSLQDAIGFCFAVSRRRAERRRLAAQNDKVAGGGFVYVDAVPGAFFGMRSSFLVDNGYLDESTFLYGEERILGKQVELAGLREALVCDATYVHDHARGRFSSVETIAQSSFISRGSGLLGRLGLRSSASARPSAARSTGLPAAYMVFSIGIPPQRNRVVGLHDCRVPKHDEQFSDYYRAGRI